MASSISPRRLRRSASLSSRPSPARSISSAPPAFRRPTRPGSRRPLYPGGGRSPVGQILGRGAKFSDQNRAVSGAHPRGSWASRGPRQAAAGRRSGFNVSYALRELEATMPDLPTGTVTFLLTDIERSTHLWEQHPEAMPAALARHEVLVSEVVQEHGGVVVKSRGEGDSLFAAFARAVDAVVAAGALQQVLHAEPWPEGLVLRTRLAVHTGDAELRAGDYYGAAVNRCARLRAIAFGGQTLLSLATQELVRDRLPVGATLRDLG